MIWKDLREFIQHLENQGELVRVSKEVSTKHEIAAYVRKACNQGGGPAFLFENVAGYPGWRVVAGIFGSRDRVAQALGSTVREAVHEYNRRKKTLLPPRVVDTAPCQEVVWEGEEADLTRLPIVWHAEKDAGPYITVGVQVTRIPETGVRAIGIHRQQVMAKDRLGLWAHSERHIGRAILQAEERGEVLPVATVIGASPVVQMAAIDPAPVDVDEFEIAGALNGEPLELVKCKTIDLEVPAWAEIVIEGEIWPGERATEAPFAEWHGGYGMQRQSPVMRVKAITMRRDAIYQTLLAAGISPNESNFMHWVFMTEAIWKAALAACPEVLGVYLSDNIAEAVVSIRKRLETEAVNVIYSVLTNVRILKYCTVVDEDIDPYDENRVRWARLTRVQPVRDVYILPVMVGVPLDPSAPYPKQSSKMGVDATRKPLDAPAIQYEEAVVPGVQDVCW